jgi:hypothetical protein
MLPPMSGHPLETLAGTWRGTGQGEYPTIPGFAYAEELTVVPVPGRALAHWRSTTRDLSTDEPRHAESGFLRATPTSTSTTTTVELVVAHGFGIVETAAGELDGPHLVLVSTGLLGTATAKHVERVERRYAVDGDHLTYAIAMAAVGVPLTHHLRAELRRA